MQGSCARLQFDLTSSGEGGGTTEDAEPHHRRKEVGKTKDFRKILLPRVWMSSYRDVLRHPFPVVPH